MKNPWNGTNEETVAIFINRSNFREVRFAETDEEVQALFDNGNWMYIREIDVNMLTEEVAQ